MTVTPIIKQILVATSPQLAAISVGGLIGYPNVLIQQLQTNDTSIELDLNTLSWIGSIHGLAGIPTVFMPTFMQWKGRKLAFLTSCLFIAIGWLLAYIASSTATILISESFHGLGSNSILIVSFCSMGEMVDPKYRNIFSATYCILQSLGIASVGILGQYLHWKTVSLVMFIPIILALLNSLFIWPESPSWLALKNRHVDCEKTFIWLRGNNQIAKKELAELLCARKERVQKEKSIKWILQRDFYVPAILMFVLLNMMYWSGVMVIIIYFVDIVKRASGDETTASYGMISMDLILFICYNICAILLKRLNNKPVLIFSTTGTMLSVLFCSVVTYCQSVGILTNTLVCLGGLIVYVIFCTLGLTTIVFNVAMELMPVKHRGIGGALYVIFTCVLHSSSLKSAPYLFLHLGLWATFLIYSINAFVCLVIVWKYVPETKNRTLQELEDYFAHGKFITRINAEETKVPIMLLESVNLRET